MPHPQEAILKEPAEATQSPRTRNTHAAHFQIAPLTTSAKLRNYEPGNPTSNVLIIYKEADAPDHPSQIQIWEMSAAADEKSQELTK